MKHQMRKMLCAVIVLATTSLAVAQVAAPDEASCEAKAVSKAGKPLSGAAKTASIKKCMSPALPTTEAEEKCEAKAVSKKGDKKLSGAAKQKFMEKCLRESA